MSIAASREPRLSKPGPSIADPSNTAAPATASHRAAAAAEAERRIQSEIAAQRAREGSPVITPPSETPISTTNSTSKLTTSIQSDGDEVISQNPGDNLARRSTKSKRDHDVNGTYHDIVNSSNLSHGSHRYSFSKMTLMMMGCMLTFMLRKYVAEVKMPVRQKRKTRILPLTSNIFSNKYRGLREIRRQK